MKKSKLTPTDVITPVAPGISWTAPEKSRPWQQPPQLTNISDVAQRYLDMFSNPDTIMYTLDALETQVPLSVLAESIMLNSVSEGLHTMDAGILVMPVIIEILASVATSQQIEYTIYPDEIEKQTVVPPRIAKMAVQKAMEKIDVMVEEVETAKPVGLMARKQKEMV
jgi:hypothetical protein